MNTTIYTIGHGNLTYSTFFRNLRLYNVNVLVDVRRIPYSSYAKHYNKEYLQYETKPYNIHYIYMGDSLGAPSLQSPSLSSYTKREDDEDYRQAIRRLIKGIKKGYIIALMCAELDPCTCHRHLLLAATLQKYNIEVLHITKHATVIPSSHYSFYQHALFF